MSPRARACAVMVAIPRLRRTVYWIACYGKYVGSGGGESQVCRHSSQREDDLDDYHSIEDSSITVTDSPDRLDVGMSSTQHRRQRARLTRRNPQTEFPAGMPCFPSKGGSLDQCRSILTPSDKVPMTSSETPVPMQPPCIAKAHVPLDRRPDRRQASANHSTNSTACL